MKSNATKSNSRLARGVETLFKTASDNHMQLSSMADNKAHILLSINSIIASFILSFLARKLSEASYLVLPTVLLLCVSITTIVFAAKPKISKGVFTKEQILNREVNLLFFGNFHRMELDVYEWGIHEIMHDKEYLYESMTKDTYFLGQVLAAKCRYLT
jgi:E3 ubiquitin-protein ligase DOA10